jgi:hypothetical protein
MFRDDGFSRRPRVESAAMLLHTILVGRQPTIFKSSLQTSVRSRTDVASRCAAP